MVYRATTPAETLRGVQQRPLETGSTRHRLGLRSLSPVTKITRPPVRVKGLRNRTEEAMLIELGSRRGEWVPTPEIAAAYGITQHSVRTAIDRLRQMYPDVQIENRTSVGFRIVGPLPAHVERIAP